MRDLFVFDYFLSYFDDLIIYELFLEKNNSVQLVFDEISACVMQWNNIISFVFLLRASNVGNNRNFTALFKLC